MIGTAFADMLSAVLDFPLIDHAFWTDHSLMRMGFPFGNPFADNTEPNDCSLLHSEPDHRPEAVETVHAFSPQSSSCSRCNWPYEPLGLRNSIVYRGWPLECKHPVRTFR